MMCQGCQNNDMARHNGIRCKIMDWKENKQLIFFDLIERGKKYE